MNLIFDLETDGFLKDVSTIHCLAIHDLDNKETYTFNDTGTKEPVVRGVQLLADADSVIGHNIIGYDLPVIRKLYGCLIFLVSLLILYFFLGYITQI